jgi:hypothetical protein
MTETREQKKTTQGQAKAKQADEAIESENERPKAPLPTLDEALAWDGLRIDGLGNKSLGRIAGIHVDAEDGEPRWALIRLGPLAGCTAIPFEHVAEGAGRLWAAYDRDWVREAPRFRPTESLTALQELELCAHWGIHEGQGRAAEVAERDAEEITAVPAKD